MPSRAKDEVSYGSSEHDRYHRLRLDGLPAQEAWRRVRVREAPIQRPQPVVLSSLSGSEARSKSAQVYQDDWATLWGQVELGPVVLVTAWWLLRQFFWAAIWMIGFTARVVVGLLWFILGFIVGFRVFSSR